MTDRRPCEKSCTQGSAVSGFCQTFWGEPHLRSSPPSLLSVIPVTLALPGSWPAAQKEAESAPQSPSLQPRRRQKPQPGTSSDPLSSNLVLHAALRMRTAPVSGLLAPVALLLLLWPSERVTDACSCSPVHPQQAFCNADIVIRAKAIVGKEVDSGNDVYGNPIKRIQYEIKQIKMFKGPTEDIQYIFTAPSSAVCGVTLETGGKKEYLIADECLWTDWTTEKSINGRQAKHYACIKRSDGSCSWYRGTAPPKQEFLDIEDP